MARKKKYRASKLKNVGKNHVLPVKNSKDIPTFVLSRSISSYFKDTDESELEYAYFSTDVEFYRRLISGMVSIGEQLGFTGSEELVNILKSQANQKIGLIFINGNESFMDYLKGICKFHDGSIEKGIEYVRDSIWHERFHSYMYMSTKKESVIADIRNLRKEKEKLDSMCRNLEALYPKEKVEEEVLCFLMTNLFKEGNCEITRLLSLLKDETSKEVLYIREASKPSDKTVTEVIDLSKKLYYADWNSENFKNYGKIVHEKLKILRDSN